jgi:LysM repeat protein
MRNLLTSLSVASILIFAGCDERQSMKVAQDKQGHAYVPEGGQGGGGLTNTLVAGEGEQYITTGPKDTLTSVAKKYNTTLAWLIKRNHLQDADKYKDGVPPGTNLIVPKLDAKR